MLSTSERKTVDDTVVGRGFESSDYRKFRKEHWLSHQDGHKETMDQCRIDNQLIYTVMYRAFDITALVSNVPQKRWSFWNYAAVLTPDSSDI